MHNDKLKFISDFRNRLVKFTLEVLRLSTELEKDMRGKIIARQIIRSASSIGANVVEARSSSSKKEFTHYFDIALKSANETQYWFEVLIGAELITKEQSAHLERELDEIIRILASSIIKLKGKSN